jgi:hypothetical protein
MQQFFQNLRRVSLIFIISISAFSSESLSPHVHGKAELHIVLDDNQLFMELNSPAMNLLGFEHGIHNSEDQAMVENTRTRLENPSALFIFNGGECVLKQQSTDFSDILITNEHDSDSHNDIKATYLYLCEKPDNIQSTQILLLDIFPNITSLQVQRIIHNQQSSSTLNHEHNEINFR